MRILLGGQWLPVAAAVGAVAVGLGWHVQMVRAEQAAAQWIRAVADAQRRIHDGAEGYTADWTSLMTPCESGRAAGLDITAAVRGYDVLLRPAVDARSIGRDCHGHDVVTNYYVAVWPRRVGLTGRRAFAATAHGAFGFFDGVPPRERDMENGALAVPLDRIDTFKIP